MHFGVKHAVIADQFSNAVQHLVQMLVELV
jgi:hypothetical protein